MKKNKNAETTKEEFYQKLVKDGRTTDEIVQEVKDHAFVNYEKDVKPHNVDLPLREDRVLTPCSNQARALHGIITYETQMDLSTFRIKSATGQYSDQIGRTLTLVHPIDKRGCFKDGHGNTTEKEDADMSNVNYYINHFNGRLVSHVNDYMPLIADVYGRSKKKEKGSIEKELLTMFDNCLSVLVS